MLTNYTGLHYYDVQIRTPRLVLRLLSENDCAAWINVKQNNYDFLQPFEPIWDMDCLTYIGFQRLLHDIKHGFQVGNYYGFVIIEQSTAELIGYIELGNILSWPKQCATVGYWIDYKKQGLGYMSEAVKHLCLWATKRLNLIKIEAGTMTTNEKSQRVLTKVGFKQEGISKAYGEIDGIFKDHVLWGITAHDLGRA